MQKEVWLRLYQEELEKRDDYADNAGRIDWDTALFFYNKGITPSQASRESTDPYKLPNPRGW